MLSLAEIDKAIIELWPQFDHKRALMRAYKAADRNGDGVVATAELASGIRSSLDDAYDDDDEPAAPHPFGAAQCADASPPAICRRLVDSELFF
jgi:hypothetical protein